MRRQNGWLTAVTLLLLLALAACGGQEAADDVEATGSESVGDVLPTPITGAKALPTRANVTGLTPDILIIAPSTALTAVDLNTLSAQLALPNGRFALALYGDMAPIGVFDFAEEMAALTAAALTAVLTTPAAPTPPLTLADALADGLALPGWRADSEPRLIVLLVDETQPDEEMLALAAMAVSQNMQLVIVQPPGAAGWAEVAEMGNGRVLLLPETPPPGEVGGSISTLITEAITAITETSP